MSRCLDTRPRRGCCPDVAMESTLGEKNNKPPGVGVEKAKIPACLTPCLNPAGPSGCQTRPKKRGPCHRDDDEDGFQNPCIAKDENETNPNQQQQQQQPDRNCQEEITPGERLEKNYTSLMLGQQAFCTPCEQSQPPEETCPNQPPPPPSQYYPAQPPPASYSSQQPPGPYSNQPPPQSYFSQPPPGSYSSQSPPGQYSAYPPPPPSYPGQQYQPRPGQEYQSGPGQQYQQHPGQPGQNRPGPQGQQHPGQPCQQRQGQQSQQRQGQQYPQRPTQPPNQSYQPQPPQQNQPGPSPYMPVMPILVMPLCYNCNGSLCLPTFYVSYPPPSPYMQPASPNVYETISNYC